MSVAQLQDCFENPTKTEAADPCTPVTEDLTDSSPVTLHESGGVPTLLGSATAERDQAEGVNPQITDEDSTNRKEDSLEEWKLDDSDTSSVFPGKVECSTTNIEPELEKAEIPVVEEPQHEAVHDGEMEPQAHATAAFDQPTNQCDESEGIVKPTTESPTPVEECADETTADQIVPEQLRTAGAESQSAATLAENSFVAPQPADNPFGAVDAAAPHKDADGESEEPAETADQLISNPAMMEFVTASATSADALPDKAVHNEQTPAEMYYMDAHYDIDSGCESLPTGISEDTDQSQILQHSESAGASGPKSAGEKKEKRRRRKVKPSEFVKMPANSTADSGAYKEPAGVRGPSVFEARPRINKAADVSYSDEVGLTSHGPALYEKSAAPSRADVSFQTSTTYQQKRSVFASHASPSTADMSYASPPEKKTGPSLYISSPKQSMADTGAMVDAPVREDDVCKTVFERVPKPSSASVRACDPAPQPTSGPSIYCNQPAKSKAHVRACDQIAEETQIQAAPVVYESEARNIAVSAKWCDPVTVRTTTTIFESRPVPSKADAAADRSLSSDEEYETDSGDE